MIKKIQTHTIKSEKGVTLVALVITIIILLILSSVTLSSVTGEKSLLSSTQKQKNEIILTEAKQEVEVAIEKVKLSNANNTNLTVAEFAEQLRQKLSDNDESAQVNVTDEGYEVIYKGNTFNYYYDNV